MRRIIIAGNWKMHTDAEEARALAMGISDHVSDNREPVVVICPPFPLLTAVYDCIKFSPALLGAQNVHFEEHGAFTGEVSGGMLESVGCAFVIIGHSERRALFQESDEFLNRKLLRVLSGSMTPVFCIGETLDERKAGKTFERIDRQMNDGLKNVEITEGRDLVIAYEPVWAIGTGQTATPEQAEEVHSYIRDFLKTRFSDAIAEDVTIQYGGSVKPENARELLSQPNIDGALVGGASLKVDSFTAIIAAAP
ncbi:triose-phosphate isomerase [candidate division KSB1 bacterium]